MNPAPAPDFDLKKHTASSKIQALVRGRKLRTHLRSLKNAVERIENSSIAQRARDTVRMYSRVQEKKAYQGYLQSHTVTNSFDELMTPEYPGWEGLKMLRGFRHVLTQAFEQHGGVKMHLSAKLRFSNTDGAEAMWWLEHGGIIRTALTQSQLMPTLFSLGETLREKATEKELTGSGWKFEDIVALELHITRYKPLGGAAYTYKLPYTLLNKKAVINVEIPDLGEGERSQNVHQCFKYAVCSALYPPATNPQRGCKYHQHFEKLDWKGMSFPTPLRDLEKFERNNNISINVYGWKSTQAEDECFGYPLRITKLQSAEKHINLLLDFKAKNPEGHYCWIKNFSRFARRSTDGHNGMRHYCQHCLHGFLSEEKLQHHLSFGCGAVTETRPTMPEEGTYVQFKDWYKQFKVPFVIYADFETLLNPVEMAEHGQDESFTETFQEHVPCGYCFYVVAQDESVQIPAPFDKPVLYRGPDTVDHFIETIQKAEDTLVEMLQEEAPMIITPEFGPPDPNPVCIYCHQTIDGTPHRDHDHLTGLFRGLACATCNMEEGKARTKNAQIPVFFHNLKGFDGNLIIERVGRFTSDLSAIPQNYEKLISFKFGHLRFLDTLAFLSAGLDTLQTNLYDGGKGRHKFVHTLKHCPQTENVELMLKKGVYPYDYMSSWERFEERQLPPQESFYSELYEQDCDEADYNHAQNVWTQFQCQTLGQYHDLYLLTDVLLLADIFEAHRMNCLTYYKLDPAHFFTTPNFAWNAMLAGLYANEPCPERLELLTDYNMHLMVEQGLRGGISMISHRHAKANNPYMGDKYDKAKEHSYISYLDANNLYGHAMIRPLPYADFQWSQERDLQTLLQYADEEGLHGAIVKVDLQYPADLHDEHNDYPLAPERKLVTGTMLSPYASTLKDKLQIGNDVAEKLVPNLEDKLGYVCDIRALKYYIDHGLQVSQIHAVITFQQKRWLQPYIQFNTERRKQATNDFEKDFFKLMSNACFGKTMENLRSRVEMDFITSNKKWDTRRVDEQGNVHGTKRTKLPRTVERKLASPLYQGHVIYNDDLVAIKKKKKELTLNKPIYAGMAILDLSKLHMFEFHYDFMKPQYGSNAQLLFTDTDSLCYHIKTDDFYKDMWQNKHQYDLSNFPTDKEEDEEEEFNTAKFYDASNKKVLGKFKDECDGKPAHEFVGLRPKMYSLQLPEGKEKKTGKGIQKRFVKTKIKHSDYRRCIQSEQRQDQQQRASWKTIRNKTHRQKVTEETPMMTQQIAKIGLCAYDNKRWLRDAVSSYAYGHCKIAEAVARYNLEERMNKLSVVE